MCGFIAKPEVRDLSLNMNTEFKQPRLKVEKPRGSDSSYFLHYHFSGCWFLSRLQELVM